MVARRDLPTKADMKRNLSVMLGEASTADWRHGEDWYDNARAYATHLADAYGYTIPQCAAVIAVLSPRIPWTDNKAIARTAIEQHANEEDITVTLTNGNARAQRNLDDPNTADALRYNRTRKVNAFYRNIMGDETVTTIDRHMIRAVLGDIMLGEDNPSTDAAYVAISDAVVELAGDLDMKPTTLQAIVWCYVERVRRESYRKATVGTAF